MTKPSIIKWHRLFGLALEQDFHDYDMLRVEREKDMSIKEQLLDILVVYTDSMDTLDSFLKNPPKPLPDGLDNLAQHNLISYKSLREPLNEWTIQELIGHYVNYRKNNPVKKRPESKTEELLPESHFQLYAVSTRFPENLMSQYELKEVQEGVYEVTVVGITLRVLVLSRIPEAERNAIWNIFSNVVEKIEYGALQYGPKLKEMSSVLDQLFKFYQLEGVHMAYSFEQFEKDHFLNKVPEMLQDEEVQPGFLKSIAQTLSLDKILSTFLEDERLRQISVKKIMTRLSTRERLEGLSPDERLEGLSPDEIKSYLKQFENAKEGDS